jgi:hypothetical protein
MKQIITTILLVFTFSIFSQAQSMWGINMNIYQTKGDFNKNVEAVPVGISLSYLHRIKESKFSVGAEFGIAMYADNEYKYELPSGEILTIDEEDCFWTLHADVRYYAYEVPALKAYVQGRLGMTTFFSSVTPRYPTPEFQETFQFHGTAFNLGIGGGALINFKALFNNEKKQGVANLDLGINVHTGTSTEYRYMPEGTKPMSLDEGTFQSVTNYVDYRIGIVLIPSARR